MTNKQISDLLTEAGVKVPANSNRKALEALAAENNVALPVEEESGGVDASATRNVAQESDTPEGGEGATLPPAGDERNDDEAAPDAAEGAGDDEAEDLRPRGREVEVLEATLRYRGRVVKLRPALDREGFQAVCEEFPQLVGFGDDEQEAMEELLDAIEDAPVPEAGEYDPGRMITPTMAVCAMTGDHGARAGFLAPADEQPSAGEAG